MSVTLKAVALFIILGSTIGAHAQTPDYAAIARELGSAYAKDLKRSFGGVSVEQPMSVTAENEADLEGKVIGALSIIYVPLDAVPRALSWSSLREIATVRMKEGRQPEEVVRQVIQPGRVVIRVRWNIGQIVLESFSVFDRSSLLFDSLVSMPFVDKPYFEDMNGC